MTHTIIQVGIRLRALPISSSQGNSGRPHQLWIFLCWIMLSLAGVEPIHWGAGIIVSGKQGYFDPPFVHFPHYLTHPKQ